MEMALTVMILTMQEGNFHKCDYKSLFTYAKILKF